MRKIVGIECGFPLRTGNRRIDELEKTQHYTYFASDLLKAKGLGIDMIRYGIPWHRVEPENDRWDWNWVDGALDLIAQLGIEPIVDLCHFGTPDWLAEQGGFASPDFPAHFADYVEAFARRYKDTVRWYTLINEPLITARFCGREGFWHPFRKDAFGLIVDNLSAGIVEGAQRVRAIRRDACLMQNDNCEHHTAGTPTAEAKVVRLNEERFLLWDRTEGSWDVIGLDYYPWSEERHLGPRRRKVGHFRGLYQLAKDYYARYKRPLLIAETDAAGSIEERLDWLEQTLTDCQRLNGEGIPVLGYTWWPLIDNINWGAFRSQDTPDNAGLYAMVKNDEGRWERAETPLVARFRRFLAEAADGPGPGGPTPKGGPLAVHAAP
jgi:beta-glucosidase